MFQTDALSGFAIFGLIEVKARRHYYCAHMNAKKLHKFKRALESRRRALARVLSPAALNTDDLDHGRDEGDRANTALSKELVLLLSAQDQKLFAEVENALTRIANGSFGDCLNCDQGIPAKRLEALPWTPYCITCQELIEEQGAQ